MPPQLQSLEKSLDRLLEKLFLVKMPVLSAEARSWVVRILPWWAVITGVLGMVSIAGLVWTVLLVLIPDVFGGLFDIGNPAFSQATALLTNSWVIASLIMTLVVSLLSSILKFVAFKPLRRNEFIGWRLVWYAVASLVIFQLFNMEVFGLVWSGVYLYFLYQVKSHYSGLVPPQPSPENSGPVTDLPEPLSVPHPENTSATSNLDGQSTSTATLDTTAVSSKSESDSVQVPTQYPESDSGIQQR